jgi:hypothetical protein
MPVTYGMFSKQLKLLPLILSADGSAQITVRFGYCADGGTDFTPVTEQTFQISPEHVSSILDAAPATGLTRRDDLSYAVYGYLVKTGLIEPGHIS